MFNPRLLNSLMITVATRMVSGIDFGQASEKQNFETTKNCNIQQHAITKNGCLVILDYHTPRERSEEFLS
jgi:hypothetical protein